MKGASLPLERSSHQSLQRERDCQSQLHNRRQTSSLQRQCSGDPKSSMGGSTSRSGGVVVEGSSSGGRRTRPTRGREGCGDEREVMALAMKEKETEWMRERKRLKEELKRLRNKLEEKESEGEWEWVVEQMWVDRAVRDEAVERWKKLYLAIKNELDDLIHTTYGEGLQQRHKEGGATKTIEELKEEVKVREETIDRLKERIALMEKQQHGNEREIDILRQSLRIISSVSTCKKKKKKKEKSPSTINLPIFKNTCVC